MTDRIKLSVVTADGSVGVLADHAPMLLAVAPGVVHCRFGESETAEIQVGTGVASVRSNQVSLLVSSAEENP